MNTPGGFPVEPFAAPGPGAMSRPVAASEPGPPAPPPGPGVTPPFTAPPRDRSRRGLWIGLSLGALALIVCCAGGLVGFGFLAVNTSKQLETAATSVVRDYLHALENRDYDRAYSHLCPALTRRLSANDFAEQQQVRPRPVAYTVHKPQIGNIVLVSADVRYEDGTSRLRRYELTQEMGSQDLRICAGI
jgi:hypothetical protein